MSRQISPVRKLSAVPQMVSSGAVQARKRLILGDPFVGIKTGEIFEIFTFEPLGGDKWECVCRDLGGHWYSMPEGYFDWSQPDFEVDYWEARRGLRLQKVAG